MPEYIMTEDEKDKYGDTHNMFIQLCYEGLKRVTPPGREEEYRKRLEYEIEILEQTDSIDYMLVSWDMVNWARKNGIQTGVGRGSAAGALTLYVLGITLIDPLRFNLIFERFLLPERAGLEPREVTVIGNDMKEKEYVEVQLEDKKLRVPLDAEFMVNRNGNEMKVLATDLQPGDDVIFDRRDMLFTLKEL
jgi:DNA polymerase-3 subunit alpha